MNERDMQELKNAAMEVRRASYACGYVEGESVPSSRRDEKRKEMEEASTKFSELVDRLQKK